MTPGVRALSALAVLLLTGCGGGDADTLRVFAASSLRDVLPALAPEADVVFAGSDALATQIREGARADVFVSASPRAMQVLADAGLVGPPTVIASNRLVVIVPRARHSAVRSFAGLAAPGVRLVLGGEGVPAGDYAREALSSAGLLDEVLANVVSLEESVSGVVAKVALGEADAGIVYATDARIARDDVRELPVPSAVQPRIEYVAAVVAGGEDAAGDFVERLTGPEAQAALAAAGFLEAPS